MNKRRKVTRKYFSKRKNQWITKIYEYEAKAHAPKSKLLVGKNGRIYRDRLNTFKAQLDDADRNEVDAYIDYYTSHNKKLSERTLKSKLATDRVSKMIINTGRSPQELSEELDVPEDELLNPKNRKGTEFTYKNTKYKYDFASYTGEIIRINNDI